MSIIIMGMHISYIHLIGQSLFNTEASFNANKSEIIYIYTNNFENFVTSKLKSL